MTILLFGSGSLLTWTSVLLGYIAPKYRVVVAASPDPGLLIGLLKEPPEALVVVDPPQANEAVAMAGGGIDLQFMEQLRTLAQRTIFAIEIARLANKVLVYSPAFAHSEDWFNALADLAGTPPSFRIQDVLLRFPSPVFESLTAWCREDRTGLDDVRRNTIEGYLDPLRASVAGRNRASIVWRRELFLDGDNPGQGLPALIELAGRARILAYGPYLPLPAGAWRACVHLGFSPDVGKMPFIVEIDTGSSITRGFFEAEQAGIFLLKLTFQIVNPMPLLEIRLISQDSAIEGHAALIDVRLEPDLFLSDRGGDGLRDL